ncbi:MAG: NAD-dependent epimerase/dehydratase family protein [Armatimonadetes bacterium]|nr:NAD-dependent epimerase/dehydratase family protein [Armatimonadota bacterium]
MKICIVGGTGNISASIVRRILALGHEVVCFNRGKSGSVPEGVREIHGDRSDREAFEKAMQAEKFDAAIDMICFNKADAESSIRAFRGVGQFVQCSTVCTYGVQYDWLPAGEDHPLRPITDYGRGKVEADAAYMEAYYREGFPATIIKPSTTYGPRIGLLRQVAWEFGWVDRVRKGKPILICGDGQAIHQFLHVDDAALCFAGVLGKPNCIGQTYNMVRRGFTTWADFHRTAMKVLGREVEMVGVPLADLLALNVPNVSICRDIFAHNVCYSAEKLFRDVPEFVPAVSLENGMRQVVETMDREGRVPDSDQETWEDAVVEAQRSVRKAKI